MTMIPPPSHHNKISHEQPLHGLHVWTTVISRGIFIAKTKMWL